MYYEINISKLTKNVGLPERYEHFFATAKRSISTKEKLKEVLEILIKTFPHPQYYITVSQNTNVGENIPINKIIKEKVTIELTDDDRGYYSIFNKNRKCIEYDFHCESNAISFANNNNYEVVESF